MWGREHPGPVVVYGFRMGFPVNNWTGRSHGGGDGGGGSQFGSCSHESENDLAAMVSDFLESSSCGAESWHSSDSDSGFSDLASIHDKISVYKRSEDEYESDLLSAVHPVILSISEIDRHINKLNSCNGSCIRFALVKLLQSLGYDAAVCVTKWQFGKIPGGEHEFVDVIKHSDKGCSERYIIDIDFRSHFEIARAVKSYGAVLDSLPAVYVGSLSKLKQFLKAMADAARYSLKKNSMPLPPWRSVAYLEAKWESTSRRVVNLNESSINTAFSSSHQCCSRLLRKMKSCIQSEIKAEGELVPSAKNDEKQKDEA